MPGKAAKDGKRYGFVLTSTAGSTKDPGQLIRAAIAKRKEGAQVTVFLMGDGVLLATSTKGATGAALTKAIKAGVRVLVSKDHLDATGLPQARLIKGAAVLDKTYRDLVTMTMEEWDRVIVC